MIQVVQDLGRYDDVFFIDRMEIMGGTNPAIGVNVHVSIPGMRYGWAYPRR